MVYGFTGASRPPDGFEGTIFHALREIGTFFSPTLVTGSQLGVDEEVARAAIHYFGTKAFHVQVVPPPPGKHGELFMQAKQIRLEETPFGGIFDAYRYRNQWIVDKVDRLIAFPEGEEEKFRRSGAWMTVRMARKKGIPVRVFPLWGAKPYDDECVAR